MLAALRDWSNATVLDDREAEWLHWGLRRQERQATMTRRLAQGMLVLRWNGTAESLLARGLGAVCGGSLANGYWSRFVKCWLYAQVLREARCCSVATRIETGEPMALGVLRGMSYKAKGRICDVRTSLASRRQIPVDGRHSKHYKRESGSPTISQITSPRAHTTIFKGTHS